MKRLVPASLVILAVWLVYLLFVKSYKNQIGGNDAWPGTFGDSFGALNTLFTGLAFAGLIISIYQQSRELELQREELKLQREALQGQLDELAHQRKALEAQGNELAAQAVAMKRSAEAQERSAAAQEHAANAQARSLLMTAKSDQLRAAETMINAAYDGREGGDGGEMAKRLHEFRQTRNRLYAEICALAEKLE